MSTGPISERSSLMGFAGALLGGIDDELADSLDVERRPAMISYKRF